FCFTPKGDVQPLPRGACPIDFAYQIHTQVGHRTVGARVNGRLVPLDTRLESGDVVEVITTKAPGAGPKQDWLGFVKTSRARGRIKQWIAAHRREEAREAGKESFLKALRKENLSMAAINEDAWRTLFSDTRTSGHETLYEAIGEGKLAQQELLTILRRIFRPPDEQPEAEVVPLPKKKRASDTPSVAVAGMHDVQVKLALCCAPVPGDNIFGYVTRGKGVSVHRADCPNAGDLTPQSARLVDVEWDTSQGGSFVVTLQVAALDRIGLLRDVTDTLSDTGVMILSSQSWARRDGTARLRYSFELGDVTHLDHILRAVRSVEGVFDVYRVLPLRARPDK
ncbi:MAG TPA: TGS domain-containing protein, partial [Actinomycetota bacterium]|nr:TGS domain-containing protein [Actinomycetota bacterium]